MKKVWAFFLVFFPLLCAGEIVKTTPVRIGVDELLEESFVIDTLQSTLEHFAQTMPQYRFEVFPVSSGHALDDLDAAQIDFYIGEPTQAYLLKQKLGMRHIATHRIALSDSALKSSASVLIVKNDRKDINTLHDLKGKRVSANHEKSFSGWIQAMDMLVQEGYDWRSFFSKKQFFYYQNPDVLLSVLSGRSDVGILSACQLEQFARDGVIDAGSFRVIHAQPEDVLHCAHSTPPQQGVVFMSLQNTDNEIVQAVTIGLFQQSKMNAVWSVAVDVKGIDEIYKRLQIGPYGYMYEKTFRMQVKRYWKEIVCILIVFMTLLMAEVRLQWLVKKRTRELSIALQEKIDLEKQTRQAHERISTLQRIGVIGQMGSLIAHELKQPVAALINYAAGLQMRARFLKIDDPAMSQGLTEISSEARRVSDIVNRVRNFAKNKNEPHRPVCLSEIVYGALQTFRRHSAEKGELIRDYVQDGAWVLGNAIDLELLVLNLLKNATEAAQNWVALTVQSEGKNWLLTVSNDGQWIDDEAMARLMMLAESSKPDGLGLGLSIVRNIADSHGADIHIARQSAGGLLFEVRFERIEKPQASD